MIRIAMLALVTLAGCEVSINPQWPYIIGFYVLGGLLYWSGKDE